MTSTISCNACSATYDTKTEQHASILLFDQCIPCKFTANGSGSCDGTQSDIDAIQAKARELREQARAAIAAAEQAQPAQLTDAEIDAAIASVSTYTGSYEHAIARAVLAALGAKT